jgi:hypothetical protein
MMRTLAAALLLVALLSGCFGGSDEPEPCREPPCEAGPTPTPTSPGAPPPTTPTVPPGPGPGPQPAQPHIPANATYGPPRNWTEPGMARIRPGAALDDGSCTANFVFTSLDNRTVYLGTAAHCFSNDINTQTNGCEADIDDLNATMVVDGGGRARLVYSSWHAMQKAGETDQDLCFGNDFALLELSPADANVTSPALKHWGGPTGIAEGATAREKVLSYGNSGSRPQDSSLSPREGIVLRPGPLCDTSVVFPNPAIPGDSGSPVILGDGRALGDFVSIGIFPDAGQGKVCLLAHMLAYAASQGFVVQLATWELLDDGVLP